MKVSAKAKAKLVRKRGPRERASPLSSEAAPLRSGARVRYEPKRARVLRVALSPCVFPPTAPRALCKARCEEPQHLSRCRSFAGLASAVMRVQRVASPEHRMHVRPHPRPCSTDRTAGMGTERRAHVQRRRQADSFRQDRHRFAAIAHSRQGSLQRATVASPCISSTLPWRGDILPYLSIQLCSLATSLATSLKQHELLFRSQWAWGQQLEATRFNLH